jgi:sigma-B regulation protein RsbU (phosphoserine phosphatase)
MIYGLILVVGGGFAYWLALWISRPLRQLSVVMEHVEKGNLEERFKEEPFGFEINILGKLFNQTLDNLLFNMRRAEDERVKKETYQREIAFIRQVQESLLLPPQKEYDALEYSALYLPADEVVGDYYNYLAHESPSGEKTFLFSVVDASGTGLTSCLYALSARSLFSTYATLYDDIADILARANNDFAQEARDSGFFLRLFYGKYHCLTKTLHYCCCGHVSGLIKKFNGVTHELSHRGIAIGLKSDITYPVEKVALEAGDLVVVYTDGLVNARNEKGEVFTEERLKGLIKKNTWVSAQEVIDHISNELQRFKGVVPQKHATIAAVLKVQ